MSVEDSLRACIAHATSNGFPFRRWFLSQIGEVWPGNDEAIEVLAAEGRHYALLFSHEFASCFWREGTRIQFRVPATTYSRVNAKGEVMQVNRKPFTRRVNRRGVWEYHLRQMAVSENPLEYLCRFLVWPEKQNS